ncbi:helix-turn-helix domain-containing protein [Sporomusa sphaeroides]|uniref:Desulfoferrodoxin n=1 Tax=Sporomusa sphaeroides DSM 2875 TaxID=1337886 RepID=A0ABM9W6V1_9FIRM|nr:helix-turn-helix domain-containing protein [Sporomusa sphaeroides]OLS54719.1 desulfoferrodoxin [Sporomusa sphaeroides DSM 2875]CVK20893.1 Desulfoferrodoxin [Sporomusa sphaeroides DSM 2875]
MDCDKIGKLLYDLRKEKNMTQKQLADLMNISDKTISKWERGLGCPDVSLLPELSQILGVNIEDILAGKLDLNEAMGGNMKNLKFFVCPQCNNLLTATGDANISCCGKKLEALSAAKANESHVLTIEPVEDELYVSAAHEMKKEHYISFVAYVTGDRAVIVKQYPEWNMQFRFHKSGHGKLYFHCSNHGLFYQLI